MNFERSAIPDVIICKPDVFSDNRGFFLESFRKDKLEEFLGFSIDFCQDNESKSLKGVLRGMHYQLPPYSQSKLVRVIQGSVLDIAVDIRKGSPYFGQHIAVELNDTEKNQLFVPRGFAHGFVVLSDEALFSYKCDNYYEPDYERGFAFDDKKVNIDWLLERKKLILSEKDLNQPCFKEAEVFDYNINYYEK